MITKKVTIGYKFRIYPTKEQEVIFAKTFGCTRYVYNYFLNLRNTQYFDNQISLSRYDCIKLLPSMKSCEETSWLKEVDSIALQSSVEYLDEGFKRFFEDIKKPKNKRRGVGKPKFKSKHGKQSYTTKNVNNSIRIIDNMLLLPKIGTINFDYHREVCGIIKRATITKSKSGKYYVSLICDNVEYLQREPTGALVGIDLGLDSFITTSDGQKIEPQKYYRKLEKRLKRLQRKMSRKPKGSKNREKSRIELAKQSEKVSNKRNDFQHKVSRELVNTYDIICLEDLNVKGLQKNHKIAKSIQDAGWSSFVSKLEYKANFEDKIVIKIDRFFPSSQLCSTCGYKNVEVKDTSIRKWECPQCGTKHDRDTNASINILNEGIRLMNL